MPKFAVFSGIAAFLLLTACHSTESAQTDTIDDTEPTVSAFVSENTNTNTEPPMTAPVQMTHDDTVTFTVPQPPETEITYFTITQQENLPYQGGEGYEAHAETPEPQYFTYRFSPDGVSVRLAGGTYQILRCDLSASLPSGADSLYKLEDFNFDGYPDLLVPILISGNDIRYAAYCWQQDHAAFAEPPIFLSNPIIKPDVQQIVCLSQDSDLRSQIIIYDLENNELTTQASILADYETLTLSITENELTEQSAFLTETELTDAFLQHYQ